MEGTARPPHPRGFVDHLVLPDVDDHAVAGQRLWQDLVNGASIFLDVNKREEIILHDRRVLEATLARLDLAAVDGAAPLADLAAQLSAIEGRSPELDALLSQPPEAIDRDALRALLESIAASLGRGSAPRAEPGNSGMRFPPLI